MRRVKPSVGSWYHETSEHLVFEVVAVDEDAATIEIQHLDGEIDEFDLESWEELYLSEIEPPEDWRNGYELSSEDSADSDAILRPTSSNNPLNAIEPEITNGLIDD